jgi:hypothetical protein
MTFSDMDGSIEERATSTPDYSTVEVLRPSELDLSSTDERPRVRRVEVMYCNANESGTMESKFQSPAEGLSVLIVQL